MLIARLPIYDLHIVFYCRFGVTHVSIPSQYTIHCTRSLWSRPFEGPYRVGLLLHSSMVVCSLPRRSAHA